MGYNLTRNICRNLVSNIFCINIAFYFTSQVVPSIPIITPFNNQTLTIIKPPGLYNTTNPSGTLVQNLTNNVGNSTSPKGILDITVSPFIWPLQIIYTFVQFLTGGFFFSAISVIGFPSAFVYGFMAVMGALLGRSILYYATGR